MKKVIVSGSRNFNDTVFIYKKLDELLQQYKEFNEVEIVEGGCRGVDLIAKQYAIDNNLSYKEFPADWNRYGKSAGMISNSDMAQYADALIAFYDGKSRGTGGMIRIAKGKGLPVHIVNIKEK